MTCARSSTPGFHNCMGRSRWRASQPHELHANPAAAIACPAEAEVVTSGAGSADAAPYQAPAYWEQRAVRFAAEDEGLAAVGSYGKPANYTKAIQRRQQLGLDRCLGLTR